MPLKLKSPLTKIHLTRLFALLLLAGAILGCQVQINPLQTPVGQETQATSTPRPLQPTSTPTVTPTPDFLVPLAGLEELQIRFLHPWTGAMAREIDKQVDRFNQTNEWKIHVIVQSAGSSMEVANRLEEPGERIQWDVVAAPSEHLQDWSQKKDWMLPLNELVTDPHWGLTEQQRAEIPLSFWQQDQIEGIQLGIPIQRDAVVVVYNQSWARELGFNTLPQSLQELKEQACAAARANGSDNTAKNDGTGGWIINTEGEVTYLWMEAFGLKTPLTGNPARLAFDHPAAIDALEFLRGMADENCAWFSRNPAPQEYFANREALFYTGSLLDLQVQMDTNDRLGTTDEWTLFALPGIERPAMVVHGISLGIMKSEAEKELAAWLFLRWMTSPEVRSALLSAGGGLPVSIGSTGIPEELQKVPQWAGVLQWLPISQSVPPTPDWRIARFILQDAAWQALQGTTPVEGIPELLKQLDATIAEVLRVRGS